MTNWWLGMTDGDRQLFVKWPVLANEEGIDLITADERLYNSVKKDLDWVKWLDDV